jgi:hypothetical protein
MQIVKPATAAAAIQPNDVLTLNTTGDQFKVGGVVSNGLVMMSRVRPPEPEPEYTTEYVEPAHKRLRDAKHLIGED